MLLQFTVRGQQIFRVDKTPLASDSRLYIAGAVDFDKDGYRIIPSVITATGAFAKVERGWWKGKLYESKVESNVYTPEQYADNWMEVTDA